MVRRTALQHPHLRMGAAAGRDSCSFCLTTARYVERAALGHLVAYGLLLRLSSRRSELDQTGAAGEVGAQLHAYLVDFALALPIDARAGRARGRAQRLAFAGSAGGLLYFLLRGL